MFKNTLTLISVGLIWGSQFIVMHSALAEFSPLWVGTIRSIIGALSLVVICRTLKLSGSMSQWRLFALIGLLEGAIPFVLIPWGQQHLASSIAAILMGTMPFYATLLAPILIKGARIAANQWLSVTIGFVGLLVLFYPQLSQGVGDIDILSSLAIVVAATCFALALLLLSRVKAEHPIVVARNSLIASSVLLIVVTPILSAPPHWHTISADGGLSLLYLGVVCAGVVDYLYMLLLKNAGAVFASMANYIVPAVGVIIGAAINHEVIRTTTWAALLIILSALAVNQLIAKKPT